MVLGMAANNRKGAVVQVRYLVLVQDIRPWPPSQSLRSLRSVMIQWENGEKVSGSTNTVVPTLGSVVGEGKIEFNESFRLPVGLVRESVKGRDADTFQKNCLEFYLYEPRRDKAQLLASATVDLADYGVVRETLSISIPMNCKRSFRNTDQPVLSIKIEPIVRGRTRPSSKGGLSKKAYLDRNGSGSLSVLMNEEYLEEAEIASFTDDEVSSQSSMTVSSSTLESNGGLPPQHEEENSKGTTWSRAQENLKERSSHLASTDVSPDLESSVGGHSPMSNRHNSSSLLPNKVVTNNILSSLSIAGEITNVQTNGSIRNNYENSNQLFQEKVASNGTAVSGEIHRDENVYSNLQFNAASPNCNDSSLKLASTVVDGCPNSVENRDSDNPSEIGHERQNVDEERYSTNDESSNVCIQEASKNHPQLERDTPHLDSGDLGTRGDILKDDRLKHVTSVRSSSDSVRRNGLSSNQPTEIKDGSVLGDVQSRGSIRSNERKDAKVYPKDSRNSSLDNKIQRLEQKMKMLEGELREAAALEAALYSVVAEHGSSISKVHAPARRLSRLYLHACREAFQSRRASVSRSIIYGLIVIAKACGNDVPRLTFWLSNSVVFRAIIGLSVGDVKIPPSSGLTEKKNVAWKGKKEISPQLKWKDSSSRRKENSNISGGSLSDWEDPHTFVSALERVEGWIFSRIIESVWWQTLTPHMQLAIGMAVGGDAGSCSIKKCGRMPSSADQEQGNFSLEHWKKAFKDACERLCPVRAGGHECGCLPVLARLIMEQCVARLDVAMFNAILRESSDEMPTDPLSDPISNSAVLPIPAGKASFGAGAQLKNAIGNWSRWLSNLFGIDDDDIPEDQDDHENDEVQETSFKPFHLLNALSDLMMLPKDMLLDGSVRKELCPTFGAQLIKKVLYNFVPDEFCPDPVPHAVLEALDDKNLFEAREGSVTNHPYVAPPPAYSPPTAASVSNVVGESGSQSKLRRSGSSVVRKSYTSDDELDELNSPLSSILTDGLRSSRVQSKPTWISKGDGNQFAFRYELLREVWMSSE